MSYLLDTNIVSLAIKNNRKITTKLEAVQAQRKRSFISCITYTPEKEYISFYLSN